jgi:GTP:adenosylcobinamide-phosphate guanylyltransferase
MANIEIIILCGGFSKRWNNYLGVEKHFAKINGAPLIENTLSILKNYSVNVSLVVREDRITDFQKYNCSMVTVNAEQASLEYYKIKSTYSLWNADGQTIILMGDVWYTEKSIKKILTNNKRSISFWGRQRKNFHTNCPHGELFAISFYNTHFQQIRKACEKLEKYIEIDHIKIAGGWGMYNIISNLDFLMTSGKKVIKGKVLFSNFNNITDITDDIDKPIDYDNLIISLNKNEIQKVILSMLSCLYYFKQKLVNILFEIKLNH